jgi:hypothetical protein
MKELTMIVQTLSIAGVNEMGDLRVCYRMPVNLRLASGDRVGLGKIQWR